MTTETEAPANAEEQAPAPVQDTEQEQTPLEQASEETEEEQPKPEKKDRLQLRFSDLTRQRDEKAQEADYWRQEALRQQGSQPKPQEQAQAVPDPSQYDNGEFDPKYIQAMIDHGVKTTVAQTLEQERARASQEATAREATQKITTLKDKLLESGLEGAIILATSGTIPVSQAMVEALAVSENAPALADHLGRNPGEVARIANLPPSAQGYELAKLEARLATTPKPVTNAKPPPTSLTGNRGAPTGGQRDDMPIEQWMALENAKRR